MKKICLIVCIMSSMLLLPPVSLRAQDSWREKVAPVLELRDSLLKLIPYYDEEHHLTLQNVTVDVDYKYMKMTIAMEKGWKVEDVDWYLDYLTHHPRWSMAPLGELGFDLRVLVKTDKNERKASGGGAYTYSYEDILQALQPSLQQQACEFIAAYARHVASTLPHATGEGETMVECRYDEGAKVMTTTFEYGDLLWPEVRKYLEDNYGTVRKERALALVADTATSLAFAAYKGDVTLGYVFRVRTQRDSVVMSIPPWMWESVYNPGSGSMSDTLKMVQHIADEVDRQCPTVIDGVMTLVSCRLDTLSRVLAYTYSVAEQTMRSLENNAAMQQSLREAVERSFHSTAGKVLGKYVTAANVQVEYRYTSPSSQQPVVVSLTPQRIAEILEKQ